MSYYEKKEKSMAGILTVITIALILVLAIIFISIFNNNTIERNYGYVFTKIETASNFNIEEDNHLIDYVYHNETKVIYIFMVDNAVPLISETGRYYIFDEESNKFIEIGNNFGAYAALLSSSF